MISQFTYVTKYYFVIRYRPNYLEAKRIKARYTRPALWNRVTTKNFDNFGRVSKAINYLFCIIQTFNNNLAVFNLIATNRFGTT